MITSCLTLQTSALRPVIIQTMLFVVCYITVTVTKWSGGPPSDRLLKGWKSYKLFFTKINQGVTGSFQTVNGLSWLELMCGAVRLTGNAHYMLSQLFKGLKFTNGRPVAHFATFAGQ